MKRLFALALILMLTLALSACGDAAPEQQDTTTTPDTPADSTQDTTTTPDTPADSTQDTTTTPDTPAADTPLHYDTDGDGYCDHCYFALCLLGEPGPHFDTDENCICDVCQADLHVRGQGEICGTCVTCGKTVPIIDANSDSLCDLCGESQCLSIHPHADYDLDYLCDFCAFDLSPKIPAAPAVSVTVTADTATLTITPVDGAEAYEININNSYINTYTNTTITVPDHAIRAGVNEIVVRAFNAAGYSENSAPVTVGKLEEPNYHATGTGLEFLWGDVPNAQGYIIYGDDGAYLATIGLGETYDFAYLYTVDGFYFPYIQAYAEGWLSSKKCGIPVSIGSNGGPIGGPIGY